MPCVRWQAIALADCCLLFLFSYLFAVQWLFPLGRSLGFDASPTRITWGSCLGSREPPLTEDKQLNVALCIGKHPSIPKLTPNPPKSLTLSLIKTGWVLAEGKKPNKQPKIWPPFPSNAYMFMLASKQVQPGAVHGFSSFYCLFPVLTVFFYPWMLGRKSQPK